MRIAYFTNQYPKVSHSFIRREIDAVERAGLEVDRYALRGWDAELADPADVEERGRVRYLLQGGAVPLIHAGVACAVRSPLRFLGAIGVMARLARGADRPLWAHVAYLLEACLLCRWLAKRRVEHLHAHFGTNPAAIALLVEVLGGPSFSFTAHGPEEFDKAVPLHLAEKLLGARFAIAISSFGRSQMYRLLPFAAWPRVHVVRCGLETAFHGGADRTVRDVPRFVCVGRLCEQKGQALLLEALAQLVRQGYACELVLAGDGELRGALEVRARELGCSGHVRVTGWISAAEVREELLAARALVLPSFAEGLPVVLMEALALERAVITTAIAGIPELVVSGENGWLVPAGDAEALADAMRQCLSSSPDVLQQLGRAGRERVLRCHDVDIEAARLVGHFRAAAKSAG